MNKGLKILWLVLTAKYFSYQFQTRIIWVICTTGIIPAGLLMSDENVVREIDGEFVRNTTFSLPLFCQFAL